MAIKIMLVDDEDNMRVLVERIIINDGYDFCFAAGGYDALRILEHEKPDLIILDVMMPDINGYEVCQKMRQSGVTQPIIFLSAKGDILDKGAGFGVGGDDYLVKPFSPKELSLRVHALLRHHTRAGIQHGYTNDSLDMTMDTKRHRVTVRNKQVNLTPKEFSILELLFRHQGEVFTREQIIEEVWGDEFIAETTSIAVFVRKIREKIEIDPSHPEYLQTVLHVGYRYGY